MLDKSTRNRYCLRSLHGYATENGFTQNPGDAIQLVMYETALRQVLNLAVMTLFLTLSRSNLMETPGTQSQRKGETYHEYMQRLYKRPLNRGITAYTNPITGVTSKKSGLFVRLLI